MDFFSWRHMSRKSESEAPMDGCQWRDRSNCFFHFVLNEGSKLIYHINSKCISQFTISEYGRKTIHGDKWSTSLISFEIKALKRFA